MIVRPATAADASDVWAWRNDPHTRAMSRHSDEVPLADHLAWFDGVLRDPHATLLIGEVEGVKAGMVRLDRDRETTVSINVNPALRGRGIGRALLAAALAQAAGPLVAEIKDENLASRRLFEAAGFRRFETRDGVGRYRRGG